MALLEVEDLNTEFRTDEGVVEAVAGIDLDIDTGETVGIVGESGSGKSVTALSIVGLLGGAGHVTDGRVEFKGEDLLGASEKRLQEIRGDEIGMIFQDPMESLNPVLRVGDQIAETLRIHGKVAGEGVDWLERSLLGNFVPRRSARRRYPDSWERAVELMRQVGIPEPAQRATEYPHQFSGGMRQRAMIAQALACEPDLLVADEPTTALDVTIQAQILDLLESLQDDHGMAILLITHDLGVVLETCDRVAVMYAGQLVETGTVEEVFSEPRHPYTRALFESIPRGGKATGELASIPGQVPDLIDMPEACYFAPRCPYSHEHCYDGVPEMYDTGTGTTGQEARCVLYDPVDSHGPDVLESSPTAGMEPDERIPGTDARDGGGCHDGGDGRAGGDGHPGGDDRE